MIGNRIRRARLAAGLSLDELSSRLTRPISKQALSKYEHGRSQPSAVMVLELATALRVKPSRLLSDPEITVRWVGERRHASVSPTEMEEIRAVAEQRIVGELEVRHMFGIGTENALPETNAVQNMVDVEKASVDLREQWGLPAAAPVNGLIETVEEHGAIVMSWNEIDGFDGLCGWANDNIPVIVINADREPDRIRFDVAHELGHLILKVEGADLDEERVMHRFAGSFLAPKQAVFRELGTRRRSLSFAELGLCKQRWGLSMQGWTHRAHDLEIIDDALYARIFSDFTRRNWRRSEPIKCTSTDEPMLVRRLLWRALTERKITPTDAQEILPGYEQEREASLDEERPSVLDLLDMSLEDRHALMQRATAEVDLDEVNLWDAVGCETSETDSESMDESQPTTW